MVARLAWVVAAVATGTALIGVFVLWGVTCWAPEHRVRVALAVVLACLWLSAGAWFRCRLAGSTPTRYELGTDGVRVVTAEKEFLHWSTIKTYRFRNHPALPGIRRLEFKIRGLPQWRSWSFDPAQLEEAVIESVFRAHGIARAGSKEQVVEASSLLGLGVLPRSEPRASAGV